MASAWQQTQKAKWRGEVKVQVQLAPQPGASFLVTSEDGSIYATFPTSRALRRVMRSRLKAYFKATLLGDGTIDLRQEVPERRW